MKKFLLFIVLLVASLAVSAETIYFRTTAFCSSTYNDYSKKWNNWSSWEDSDMSITMNLDNDVIKVYSPKVQTYKIYKLEGQGRDSDGESYVKFKFIDQDGDYGTLMLYQRSSGKSEIYIIFANIKWCYQVVRI